MGRVQRRRPCDMDEVASTVERAEELSFFGEGHRILGGPPWTDTRLREGVHSTSAETNRYGVSQEHRGGSWLGAGRGCRVLANVSRGVRASHAVRVARASRERNCPLSTTQTRIRVRVRATGKRQHFALTYSRPPGGVEYWARRYPVSVLFSDLNPLPVTCESQHPHHRQPLN